ALYEGLIADKADKPLADYDSEAIRTRMQYWNLLKSRKPKKADHLLDQVQDQLERLPPDKAGQDAHRLNRAVLLSNRGIHHQRLGALDEADRYYVQAENELKRLDGRARSSLELARVEVNRAALLWQVGATDPSRREELARGAESGRRAVERLLKLLEA